MSDSTPEFILEMIPVAQLHLDARYQRDLEEDRVDEIADNFTAEQFQPVTIGMRPDNTLQIVDGQHRVAAAKKMNWNTVPCMVFLSDGHWHEALVYERLQSQRKNLTVAQRWKARLARGEVKARAITEVVETLGLKLSGNQAKGVTSMTAFVACEKAYNRGNLRDTLTLIIQAWNYDPKGFRSNFIDWVSVFLDSMKYAGHTLDMKRVSSVLGKMPPQQLLRDMPYTGNAGSAFFQRLLEHYNANKKQGRIIVNDPVVFLQKYRGQKGYETGVRQGTRNLEAMQAGHAAQTPDQKAANSRKGWMKLTPEERSKKAKAASATLTPEQRRERSQKAQASRTPEERSQTSLKGAQTRAAKRAGGAEMSRLTEAVIMDGYQRNKPIKKG